MNFLIYITAFCFGLQVVAQSTVGIGNSNALNPNSLLDINSKDKGILIPRMNESQRDNISNPANSLLIFNTSSLTIDYYDSIATSWYSLEPVEKGIIILWHGERSAFDPSGLGRGKMLGWALCNGKNGTPNISGYFLAGYDTDDPDYQNIGPSTIGKDSILLDVDNLATHTHDFDDAGHTHAAGLENNGKHKHQMVLEGGRTSANYGVKDDGLERTYQTGKTSSQFQSSFSDLIVAIDSADANIQLEASGGNGFHENRPEFNVVFLIMKL